MLFALQGLLPKRPLSQIDSHCIVVANEHGVATFSGSFDLGGASFLALILTILKTTTLA
ncbi:MAG: hypothetical protein ACI9FR_003071 [Cryomorphaceae bacterium]